MSRTWHRESSLPASAHEAWAWHARPGAFVRLAPPWQSVEVIDRHSAGDGLADGDRLSFRLRPAVFGLPSPARVTWEAEHRDVEPGHRFRDVQLRGPFAVWTHEHRFTPAAEGCTLRDEITFALPGGRLADALAGGDVEAQLDRTFVYRHRLTADDLAAHRRFADRPRLDVAIAGASGMVGSALAAFLTTGGHRVRRLVRRAPEGADEVEWDPARGVLDPSQLTGVDAVVYLAGANIADGRWTAKRRKVLRASRVDALRHLGESLAGLDAPPGALISASGISCYPDDGKDHDEDDPARGDGFLAALTDDWEAAAAAAAQAWGARLAVLRLGVVLSAAGGALAKMLPAFRLGAGGPIGDGKQALSWVALDDAVGAFHLALADDAVRGPINLCAPRPVAQRDFAKTLGRVLRRPAFFPLPKKALELAFGEMADETLLAGQRAVPTRLVEHGYEYRQPELEDALRHTLGR